VNVGGVEGEQARAVQGQSAGAGVGAGPARSGLIGDDAPDSEAMPGPRRESQIFVALQENAVAERLAAPGPDPAGVSAGHRSRQHGDPAIESQ
jgi:hypothetical protein